MVLTNPLPGTLALQEFWSHRQLLARLVRRDLASRYRGSLAGLLWSLLLPCVMLGVYLFVFGFVYNPMRNAGAVGDRLEFALTLFAGLLLHGLLAECLSRAPQAIVAQTSYVKKVVFPLILLPLTIVGTALVQFLLGAGVLFAVLGVTRGIGWYCLLWPLAWLPLLAFAAGLSLLLAALTVYLRDIAQITGFVSTFLLFMAPIFYPLSSAPEGWQFLLLFNPLTTPIEVTRALLMDARLPNASRWLWHAGGSVVVLFAGAWVFQRTRRGFADVL